MSLGADIPHNLLDSDDDEPFVLELCDNRNFNNLGANGYQHRLETKYSTTKNLDQRLASEINGGKHEVQRKHTTRGSIKNPFNDNR